MAKKLKVYELAKELGVQNKAILDKCQAEGLDLKTHMAPLSAGQAATIREWFSEGAHITTVEESKQVDLDQVRTTPKKPTVEELPVEVQAEPVVEPAPMEAAAEPPTPAEEPAQEIPSAAEPVIAETPAEQAPAGETPPAEAEAVAPVFTPPVMHVPPVPENVVPAGPIHKPAPAVLSGPKVIRMEKADTDALSAPGRRGGRGGAARSKSAEQPAVPAQINIGAADASASKAAKSRGKHKGGTGDTETAGERSKRMRTKDKEERQARLAAARGEGHRYKPSRRIETRTAEDVVAHVERPEKAYINEPITVKDLAEALHAKISDIVGRLMKQKIMATANQTLANDIAEMLALEMGTELVIQKKQTLVEQLHQQFQQRPKANLQKRPPIVTMLGHVDHGKTSLLDRIRQTDVAKGEAGGITQHIGAYQVDLHGKRVTFLDTPGHEAFTSLRSRGANMTDIVVLVVAADDGLMPQTIEAIRHAKAANVEIIVALNKIDLPGTDIHRTYGQLAEYELTPTEWGGNTEIVKTSAVTGQGVEELVEHLDYLAELRDYKADPDIPATGWVVESKMTTSRGAVATLLVQEGRFAKGDILLVGSAYGRIRTITDSRGRIIKEATPSMPVEISGLDEVPQAGDRFYCLNDINQAKQMADDAKHLNREESLAKRTQITLDNLFSQIAAGNVKELNLIVKADVQGSIDALVKCLNDLSTPEIKIKILHVAVGGITEGDVVLAEASGAIIIGFNVVPDDRVRQISDSKGVDVRLYSIIYRITDDLKAAMVGMLEPEYQEKTMGRLTVRTTFKVSGVGTIAGCIVSSGVITKSAKLRLIRNNVVVKDTASIESLKHFKDDVREVKAGFECGVKIANFDDIKQDDVLEAYETIAVARTL